jgi:hypothetical protein
MDNGVDFEACGRSMVRFPRGAFFFFFKWFFQTNKIASHGTAFLLLLFFTNQYKYFFFFFFIYNYFIMWVGPLACFSRGETTAPPPAHVPSVLYIGDRQQI